jgi:outer membrane protein assembly factor BamB
MNNSSYFLFLAQNSITMLFIRATLGLFFISIVFSCRQPVHLSQWRGPDRDGIFHETDLLKEWPEDGPEILWSYEGLGAGHGNVGIGKDKLFICGMPDTIGVLYAFSFAGDLLWEKEYGVEWHKSYTGSRTTPTIVDDLVYFGSGQGMLFCYHADNGDLVWSIDLLKKFNSKNIPWGITESMLIDGDKIYCTPGGVEANVVALDRFTGETIWVSEGNNQPSAYCSPILVKHNDTHLLVTMTAESIIGVDAETGESYWSIEHQQSNKIQANTPMYHNGGILCISDWAKSEKHGAVLLQLSEDGKDVEVRWRNNDIKNLTGGYILKDGYVVSSPYNKSVWQCFDWETGNIQYTSEAFKSGVIIFADGLFYCYNHEGEMGLVDADDQEFKVISSFNVPLGENQHWAHPVIEKGILYVRHGNALMAYDVGSE